MAFDWSAAEAAIAAWIVAATGVQPVWAYQLTEYPTEACCVLDVSQMDPVDRRETKTAFDAGQPMDQEFQVTTEQSFIATVSLTFMGSQQGDLLGSTSPHSRAALALTYVQQESAQNALDAAGLGFQSIGPIAKDPELFKNTWRPNAVCEAKFYLAEAVTEGQGYISTADVEWTDAPKPALEDMPIVTELP